jgi:hypothetical protein
MRSINGRRTGIGARLPSATCLAALLFITPGRPGAAAATLTLDEYRARLCTARAQAQAALMAPARGPAPAAERRQLLAPLPLQAQVRMPAGGVVTVDNRTLAQRLSPALASPRMGVRRAGLRHFVATVDRLLEATVPAVTVPDEGQTRATLQRVLSQSEYETREKGPSWEERFVLWLSRLLERLFPRTARAPAESEAAARWMLAFVVLVLAVLVARIVLLVLPNLRRRARHGPELPVGELLVPREPEALLAEAERKAAAGEYREALRLAYLATVTRLDRAGVLPEDRSRTHWELLRALRRAGRDLLYRELAPLTLRLDERLYGGRTATMEDYQACRVAHEQIERLLCAPA